EVILGHSVAGDTPIPYRHDGVPGWATLGRLHERFAGDPSGLEVLAHDFAAGRTAWTPVRSLFRHRFSGKLLTTSQKWGVVETTPNHSIYDRKGEKFFPEERREIMAVRGLAELFAPQPGAGMDVIDILEGVPGSIDAGSKLDSAWRLYLGSQAIAKLCEHHCGRLSVNKRLPDFLSRLPTAYLRHAFDELMRTDGSRKLSRLLDETASDGYRESF